MNPPWYRRVSRWGQTNLTEIDPVRYDAGWWREHWRRTRIGGIIVNAGGIVAYYPSRYPLHHRAETLGRRDLYGEIVAAARGEGLSVIARMDSNRAGERFFNEHPDWFAVDREGRPYRAGDLYVACVNSPYYDEFLPAILREVIERSHPDGFGDNSWNGLERSKICYCANCRRRFRAWGGHALPGAHDWGDAVFRRWVQWSYERRLQIWDQNNEVTRGAGGPDCLWIGMNAADPVAQSERFRDYHAICRRSEMILLDSQWRHPEGGFQANAEAGQRIHAMLGWDRLIPESTALYAAGRPSFRVASKPAAEARLWALEGFAGGIQPWWHHIGAYHEDRRQYQTAEPLFRWHEANERYLLGRVPVATVGIVWSQRNLDFYGRDAPGPRVVQPHRGIADALLRARIPWVPVHALDVDEQSQALRLLILPAIGILTDQEVAAVRRFVDRGGSLIASGETSLYDGLGEEREDFALADVLGVHATGRHHGGMDRSDHAWDAWGRHTYLRLSPDRKAGADAPHPENEQAAGGHRHPSVAGFEGTDLLPFGGRLEVVTADSDRTVPATFVPPFPIFPPETSWMRQPSTAVPALVVGERPGGARVAYLAADVDRSFARDGLPDHAHLLQSVVRWSLDGDVPLTVAGSGRVDCHLYRQERRLILHLVNLSGADGVAAPIEEVFRIGPLEVRVREPAELALSTARLLVAGAELPVIREGGAVRIQVPRIDEHEVVVFESGPPTPGVPPDGSG